MKVDKKMVGRRIKDIRVHKCNATMEEFANMVGSGKSNVSRWERGENVPNDLTLKRIAEIGETTIEELLYGDYEARIRSILMKEKDIDPDFFDFVIDYLKNSNNKYPTEEEVFNAYDKVFNIVNNIAKKSLAPEMLGYYVKSAEERINLFLRKHNNNHDFIKDALEDIKKAQLHYEMYFDKTVEEAYQKVIDKTD